MTAFTDRHRTDDPPHEHQWMSWQPVVDYVTQARIADQPWRRCLSCDQTQTWEEAHVPELTP